MSNERITDLILQRLERIEGKLDLMQAQGCSKAEKHERTHDDVVELFRRIREVERMQDEGAGQAGCDRRHTHGCGGAAGAAYLAGKKGRIA
jgi:hypothetical protein